MIASGAERALRSVGLLRGLEWQFGIFPEDFRSDY
jgi:hypothetical protein